MDVATFRKEKDQFFAHPDSPLTDEQRMNFQGLKYFPENSALRLTIELDTDVPKDLVMMQLSTGGQRRYMRAGKIHFSAAGQPVVLTVFQDDHGYFMPFKDGTGQDESYPAGRYLEPEETADGKLAVDFNLAYNPYCAYNDRFTCPFPPPENTTPARIEAGEKRYHA